MQQLTAPHELVRRPRRLRRTATLRTLTRETRLTPERFIYPLFVRAGRGVREPIGPMPGQFRLSVDLLAGEAAELRRLGIRAVLLFGIPERKDALGSGAYDPD
ncbi:MAG: porphobilinogen synthase, partial [Armatimonadota bacterium]|nr:porphobilinogen synthase [Armatimonadota bacterium]